MSIHPVGVSCPDRGHAPLASQFDVIAQAVAPDLTFTLSAESPPPVGLRPGAPARLPTGLPGIAFQTFREGGRLSEARTPRRLQLALQAINQSVQPVLLAFELVVPVSQRGAFALGPFRALALSTILVAPIRRLSRRFRHDAVMPECLAPYKQNPLINYDY